MGVTGADVLLSEYASKKFPYSVECKNQESLAIWKALEQAESETRDSKLTSLLVFKRNRSDTYCALKFDNFMNIIKELDHYKKECETLHKDKVGESL